MQTTEGFVKLPRSILNWRWYDDLNAFKLYLHLLLKANFKDAEWKNETIKKGQVVTGRKKLAEELKMNENTVRGALKKLESSGYVAIKSTNKYSVITLLKWDDLGDCPKNFTNKSPTNHHQNTNKSPQYKKEKNDNNEKNYYARARGRENLSKIATYDLSLVDKIINES